MNAKPQPSTDLFARILHLYNDGLSITEQRVADHLLNNKNECISASVQSLSDGSGVSQATVVRFARRLGYSGFLDLKRALLKETSSSLNTKTRLKFSEPLAEKNVLHQVMENELANFSTALEQFEEKSFQRFSQILLKSTFVYTWGSGVCASLSRMFSYQLTNLGKRSIALQDSNVSFDRQLRLGKAAEECLVVFSFPPYAHPAAELVHEAKTLELPVLLITDKKNTPISSGVQALLVAPSQSVIPLNSVTTCSVVLTALLTSLKGDFEYGR